MIGDSISKLTRSMGFKECEKCKRRKETLNNAQMFFEDKLKRAGLLR